MKIVKTTPMQDAVVELVQDAATRAYENGFHLVDMVLMTSAAKTDPDKSVSTTIEVATPAGMVEVVLFV